MNIALKPINISRVEKIIPKRAPKWLWLFRLALQLLLLTSAIGSGYKFQRLHPSQSVNAGPGQPEITKTRPCGKS